MAELSFLERVFSIQERILARHIAANMERFGFISAAFGLLSHFEISAEEWESIPVEMRSIFNFLRADALSTLISATRLCLHGCDTDALALMRVALEELTILDYIATKRLYHSAFAEIQEGSRRGKAFSDRFSYETAVKGLNVTDRRDRLRGHLSTLGSHASPARLSLTLVRRAGTKHLKAGVALDSPEISYVLGEIAALCLFAVRVTSEFFQIYLKAVPSEFSTALAKLETNYDALKVP